MSYDDWWLKYRKKDLKDLYKLFYCKKYKMIIIILILYIFIIIITETKKYTKYNL